MKRLILLGVLVLALSIGAALFFMESSSGSGKQVAPASEPQLSPFFQQAAEKLGLQGEGLSIFKKANPQCTDSAEGDKNGEYAHLRITIKGELCRELDSTTLLVIMHEYLHAVWANYPSSENDDRISKLLSYQYWKYRNVPSVKSAFDYWESFYGKINRPREEWILDESHSLFSEYQESGTPPELNAWYNRWVPNRPQLELLSLDNS